MIKLSKGQVAVLVATSLPMAAAGIAGGIASYFNFAQVLAAKSNAVSLVLAGEGATVICALVALAVTLMGQHTPGPARAGLWVIPMAASVAGVFIAPDTNTKVVMGLSPLAMTAAGEGITLVARRIVAFRTGVDIEQQRRSGLLLWHANRAANGGGLGRRMSRLAVWRLTRKFAETDTQLSVQLGEIQRYRIGQGADGNLAAVIAGTGALTPVRAPALPPVTPAAIVPVPAPLLNPEALTTAPEPSGMDEHFADVAEVMAEAGQTVAADPTVRLLTTAEVAAMRGVAPGTVRSWAHRGKLPRTMVDGVPMYHPLDVTNLD